MFCRVFWDEETLARAQPQTKLIEKPPEKTMVEFKFGSDPILREHYRNPFNGVRIGKILEDMDSLAGQISYRHCDDANPNTRPAVMVTATVEAIHMNITHLTLEKDMTV